jgi:hypothetical protein
MNSTYQVIEAFANQALSYQHEEGYMPSGHNGPYLDPETPVRNTSHWAITFLKAWEITENEVFKESAVKCLNYLFTTHYRTQYTFKHRDKEGKDQCNGLIGPAWNMEALLEGYKKLGDERYLNLAQELFLLHPFDKRKKVWHRVEPDGQILPVDISFNHQFWFFATASPLLQATNHEQVAQRLHSFANHIERHLRLRSSDRIVHVINFLPVYLKERLKGVLKPEYHKKQKLKEVGYHAFNTYAFALLYQEMPHLSFFSSAKFKRTLNYLTSREYLEHIPDSIHGFPYNPPGFEVAFTGSTFNEHFKEEIDIAQWVNRQLEFGLNEGNFTLENNTKDPTTATARIYELTRLPDTILK